MTQSHTDTSFHVSEFGCGQNAKKVWHFRSRLLSHTDARFIGQTRNTLDTLSDGTAAQTLCVIALERLCWCERVSVSVSIALKLLVALKLFLVKWGTREAKRRAAKRGSGFWLV